MHRTVCFKVYGSHALGMGHIYRSLALGATLKQMGWQVTTFYCNDDEASLAHIASAGYEAQSYVPQNDDAASELVNFLVLENPDALVLDLPVEDGFFLKRLRSSGCKARVIALDYVDFEESHLDVVVSLYNHDPKRIRPVSPVVAYFEGLEYAILRSQFDRYVDQAREVRPHVRDLLVSFGGSDMQNYTLRALDALDCLPPGVRPTVHVVIGPNFRQKESIRERLPSLECETHIYENIANMGDLICTCDLGIHGAGTMMMEMACVGVPSIVCPQNDLERRFSSLFRDCDAVKLLGLQEEWSPEELAACIVELSEDVSKRRRMIDASRQLIDGRGRLRIARIIEDCIE